MTIIALLPFPEGEQRWSLLHDLDDDVIPILVEAGGHDGINKSLTLKASRCLAMNTLLIEASPHNYRVLRQARGKYDTTVNAALCEGKSVQMREQKINSGQTMVLQDGMTSKFGVTTANCTSVDKELDKLRESLPLHQQGNLQLLLLILDVEGFETTAVKGVQKYRPHKAMVETKHMSPEEQGKIAAWATHHALTGRVRGFDTCFNFGPTVEELQTQKSTHHLKDLFYGAR
eukprot:scaffold2376_cov188-Amphora_coffeaeformis.AAC.3